MAGLDASPEDTRAVYDRNALAFDKSRSRTLFEARWLARFTARIPPQGRVLDLGCGGGEPIARWLMAEGFDVTGVDFAPAMLDICRTRWPDGDWRLADMAALDLGESFDAIISWNGFFHLTAAQQKACIPRLAAHLNDGGMLMLTVGHSHGEVTGTVAGEAVYHASLSPAEYATAFEDAGLILTGFMAEDPETNDHSVVMARKHTGPRP
ncbi:class I SAM-dependent DNA methyltransferase [Yoonia sp. 208BN28-4]|uniref:class I SAM-dependent DNA methyltransferase n=1 Tax=Yoonia sp. 208BN28-4 TaxID=3126505 RepID=UPI0030B119DC